MKSLRDFSLRQRALGESLVVCLAACSHALGRPVDIRRFEPQVGYTNVIRRALELSPRFGLCGRTVSCELEDLQSLHTPCVLQWGSLHESAVLERANKDGSAILLFAAEGRRRVGRSEIDRMFGGIAIEFSLLNDYAQPSIQPSEVQLSQLFKWSPAVAMAASKALIVSVVLQFCVLLAPLFIRLVTDNVVVSGDGSLLAAAGLGFGLIAIFSAMTSLLQGLSVQEVNTRLAWETSRRAFGHLIRIPLRWFNQRHLADTLGRLQGLDQVRGALSPILLGILDGALSVFSLIMLGVFSPLLAVIAGCSFAVYVLCRLLAIPMLVGLNRRVTLANIAEQIKRMETIRAIQTVKSMAAEHSRESDWVNKFVESLNAQQRSAFWNSLFLSFQSLISGVAGVLVIYFGTREILAGSISVGALMAAVAYEAQFMTRASNLFEQLIALRTLEPQVRRIAEVLSEPIEDPIGEPGAPSVKHTFRGGIDLAGICFRYPGSPATLLSDLSLSIAPTEHVAIVAPSGTGKSTLLKIIAGLHEPDQGSVFFDNIPARQISKLHTRRSIGLVLQDDELLSGTIAENVSFFSDEVDRDHLWECLRAASIDEEVTAMSAGENTVLGDQGATLSGGQKQRLFLARALYKRPKILLLDEATSHLDVAREARIIATLNSLRITRIVVSHRPDTIAAADRVLTLANGRLNPTPKAVMHPVAVGLPNT